MASDEPEDINYPSGKLGAVTRAKNKITKFCEENPTFESKEIDELREELAGKIATFNNACLIEQGKTVPDEDKAEFNKWYKKHKLAHEIFMQKLLIKICENDDDYEDADSQVNDSKDSDDLQNENTDKLTTVLEKLLITKPHLPHNEPDKFDGSDVTLYRTFELTFQRMIEAKCDTYDDKFYYLLRYTTGEANALVRSCHGPDYKKSYTVARKLLETQYGNEYRIAQHYLDKLQGWPEIKFEDCRGLSKFASFLTTCCNMMGRMSALSQLNSWRDIKEIVMKLPFSLRTQFRIKAQALMQKNKQVDFKMLVQFVNEQSELLNLPLLGEISQKTKIKPINPGKRTFTTNEINQTKGNGVCLCCNKTNHLIKDCYFFLKKKLRDREDFIRKKSLCFGCLNSTSHQSRNCQSKLTCKTCNGKHPTALHRDANGKRNVDRTQDTTLQLVNAQDGKLEHGSPTPRVVNLRTTEPSKIVCPALPVILKNKYNNLSLATYMALDNCSTSSYMSFDIMQKLNLDGKETELKVTTIENTAITLKAIVVKDLLVESLNGEVSTWVPRVYAKEEWPFDEKDSPNAYEVSNIAQFRNIPFQFIDAKIGILIGMDQPDILKPLQVVSSSKHGPYASRHMFGWALNGPVKGNNFMACFRSRSEHDELHQKFNDVFASDFSDVGGEKKYSIDETRWLNYIENNTTKIGNQFSIPLPFKEIPNMPNNFYQVQSRFQNLVQKLKKDPILLADYTEFMKTMQTREFIERVPESETCVESGKCWFLTHHGVRHKQKGKLRVVFDCSLPYKGKSLNSMLWKGPDLANSSVGVLLRFRLDPIAVTGDIEKMYHMIKLPECDRNYLRLLWFPDNCINSEPVQFRMTVHLFGATTSSSVANYALQKCVEVTNNVTIKQIVKDSFYVDDMMKSFPDVGTAIANIKELSSTLASGSFNLTAYASNSRPVLTALCSEKLSKKLDCVDLNNDYLPCERTLGLKWDPNCDYLGFEVKVPNQPNTKRGILSTIHSIYDPLFLVSPALVQAKRLFQLACHMGCDWDDTLPERLECSWDGWKEQVTMLNNYNVPRCVKGDLLNAINCQLHIFADGSLTAYGAVAYMRYEDCNGNLISSIVMAKARLTPLDRQSLKTVPRIELNAAKVAVELFEKIKYEYSDYISFSSTYFWTDSVSTLQYIRSETGNFQTFVANRIAYITRSTDVHSWRYVPGWDNPADLLSRGTSNVAQFMSNDRWKYGPSFLSKSINRWPEDKPLSNVSPSDPERKKIVMCTTDSKVLNCVEQIIASTSDIHKLRCRIAALLRFKNLLRKLKYTVGPITIDELHCADIELCKFVQYTHFREAIFLLSQKKSLPKASGLKKLNPFLDKDGLIRVGGRLTKAPISYDAKHPVILHGNSAITKLLIEREHVTLGHLGKDTVVTSMRQQYYIVKLNKVIKEVLRSCVICRKVQGKPVQQIMADLPVDRLTGDAPPFTNTATDLFGPFFISRGRGKSQEKRYGVLFTCLACRAAHLEIVHSLDTSSYINALRRFICRRGSPTIIRSDNGTNLTAADKELKLAINEWNKNLISETCKQKHITWLFQPPHASHFGGVFEREIRTIRKVLNSLLREFCNQTKLTDEVLVTLFCEVENILNNRPLTVVSMDNADAVPLTANTLLRLQSTLEYPPGIYSKDDVYCKRRWRQAQYLADSFWYRWKREYLPLLIERQKWVERRRSLEPGDLVMVTDQQLPRNHWGTGVVSAVFSDSKGDVRTVEIDLAKREGVNVQKYKVTRPVDKVILLITAKNLRY